MQFLIWVEWKLPTKNRSSCHDSALFAGLSPTVQWNESTHRMLSSPTPPVRIYSAVWLLSACNNTIVSQLGSGIISQKKAICHQLFCACCPPLCCCCWTLLALFVTLGGCGSLARATVPAVISVTVYISVYLDLIFWHYCTSRHVCIFLTLSTGSECSRSLEAGLYETGPFLWSLDHHPTLSLRYSPNCKINLFMKHLQEDIRWQTVWKNQQRLVSTNHLFTMWCASFISTDSIYTLHTCSKRPHHAVERKLTASWFWVRAKIQTHWSYLPSLYDHVLEQLTVTLIVCSYHAQKQVVHIRTHTLRRFLDLIFHLFSQSISHSVHSVC